MCWLLIQFNSAKLASKPNCVVKPRVSLALACGGGGTFKVLRIPFLPSSLLLSPLPSFPSSLFLRVFLPLSFSSFLPSFQEVGPYLQVKGSSITETDGTRVALNGGRALTLWPQVMPKEPQLESLGLTRTDLVQSLHLMGS